MGEQPPAPPGTRVFDDELEAPVVIDREHQTQIEHQWKLYTARFEYAWRYFDFHAKQRTTMFNFFVVFSGFLINACILLFQKQDYLLLLVASVLGTAITLFFVFLERRNEELVHIAEDILRALEKDVLFKDFKRTIKWPKQRKWLGDMDQSDQMRALGIFVRQDDDEREKRESKYFHGTWLPGVQYAIGLVYLFLALVSLFLLLGSCVPPWIRTFWQYVSTLCRP